MTTSLLALVNQTLGQNLNVQQFEELVFLHELSHIANGQQAPAPDTNAFNNQIIAQCIN
jgi:hypothetical protein